MPRHAIALVRDLMFSSKIIATARELGIEVKIVRSPEQVASFDGDLLLVDLSLAGAIQAAEQWKNSSERKVIAFAAHVDTATLALAREAGFDQVLTRGQFSANLSELLR